MQDNLADVFLQPEQINSPSYKPSKKPLVFVILLFLVAFIFLLSIVFYFVTKSPAPLFLRDSLPIPSEAPPSSTVLPSGVISPSVLSSQLLVAYFKEDNIWLVRSDGTMLRQITRDGESNVKYSSLLFLNDSEIGFVGCEIAVKKCKIYTKNIIDNEEKTLLEEEGIINVFAVDKNRDLIAFIKTDDQEGPSLYLVKGDDRKKVLTFQPSLGRGAGLDDEVSLSFSPGSEYLLVVNTSTQPNQLGDKTTIWIVDKLGNLVDSIQKELATDAFWFDQKTFFYRNGSFLFRKIVGGVEENLGNFLGYDPYLSSFTDNILIWNKSDNGETTLFSYLIDKQLVSEVKKGLGYAKWLDDKNIIAVKTRPSDQSYLGFETGGLVRYNLETGQESILDSSSSIYQFVIQPQKKAVDRF